MDIDEEAKSDINHTDSEDSDNEEELEGLAKALEIQVSEIVFYRIINCSLS